MNTPAITSPSATEAASPALISFDDYLARWLAAGSPQYPEPDYSNPKQGFYFGAPVHSSRTARINSDGLPAEVVARLPKEDTHNVYAGAIVGPSWTAKHGIVLDVYYSGYCNGWSLFGVGTYLPAEKRWVHPTEVHTYSTPDSV